MVVEPLKSGDSYKQWGPPTRMEKHLALQLNSPEVTLDVLEYNTLTTLVLQVNVQLKQACLSLSSFLMREGGKSYQVGLLLWEEPKRFWIENIYYMQQCATYFTHRLSQKKNSHFVTSSVPNAMDVLWVPCVREELYARLHYPRALACWLPKICSSWRPKFTLDQLREV